MNMQLFISILGVTGVIYVLIGAYASKKVESSEEYFLMGRKLSYMPLFLTLAATQLGGGTLIGAAQEAYARGWIVLLYPLGVCIGLLALGLGVGGRFRRLNISTVAEVFEKIFGSAPLRKIASGLSIIGLFFILSAQGIAAKQFFIGLGLESPLIFVLFWLVLVAYTAMGGIKAVIGTDILQALFIIGVLALVFFVAKAPDVEIVQAPKQVASVPWLSWMLMPLLFMLIEQDMGQRCFSAKNPKAISLAAITAGVVVFLTSSIAIYFGVRAQSLNLSDSGSVLIEAIKILTSPQIAAFFMAAIFMAIISTADSILCSISSNLSFDFLKAKRSRLLTFVIGTLSLVVALLFDNVLSLLMLSYELSVCVLVVPVLAALFDRAPSSRGAYLSMGLGVLALLTFRVVETPLPKELLSIAFSCGGYFIGRVTAKRRVAA